MSYKFVKNSKNAIPITIIQNAEFNNWLKKQSAFIRHWTKNIGFAAKINDHCLIAAPDGTLLRVLAGVEDYNGIWSIAHLPPVLPSGTYFIDRELGRQAATYLAIGWAMACYRFKKYKTVKSRNKMPVLVWPNACDQAEVKRTVDAISLARDLINTPAEDMGPAELAAAARQVARLHKAKYHSITGDSLLKKNFPTIHAVGRAASKEPRILDITWGRKGAPKLTLVGKGVCFDTGGLDLKSASGMARMKKDMAGAACVLGLSHMIMDAGIDVRLRVLIGAVENSVSGNAYRPADVIKTRAGITVEIGNTDAEGRLVMCDALALASEENPDLIVDYSTLTGAARVALGSELAAYFCNDEKFASDLQNAGEMVCDPVWRLPLWREYRYLLDSSVADINNVGSVGQGGAITAALYLSEFIGDKIPWVHFDIMGWNTRSRSGRPIGGDVMGVRALYSVLEKKFGK
ncbi:MAG: leucyl aminopeptidase [Rhodospirillaceae bacterium]|nr:leucyl aminopeptidase [Rhodospirillaceae bacterium]|tara:strand:+ start:5393 stop:6775 length:1383 start_codon:yes stop_codon:yes gene_type:complete